MQTFKASEISYYDFIKIWVENYCKINCKETTINGYLKKINNYILPVLGEYRISSITTLTVQELINKLVTQHFSRNTIISIQEMKNGEPYGEPIVPSDETSIVPTRK